MTHIDLETMTRLRNKAALELSERLKRMPKDEEITELVCEWIAKAWSPKRTDYEIGEYESAMIEAGYWNKRDDR